MYRRLLFVYVLSLSFLPGFSQTIEQAYGLWFQSVHGFRSPLPFNAFSIDTTQVTNEGFHPLRFGFSNVGWDTLLFRPPKEGRLLYWSKTVVLPVNAGKKECSITLNCKSDVDSLRFVAIALDKEDNDLYTDSVIIHPATQWTDYSLKFRKKEVRAVKITIRYNGNSEANKGLYIYLNRIIICVGNQVLNDLPISSLVCSDIRLNPQAIIPLSFENDASLSNIHDWKDRKVIALGDVISGIRDLREVQIQFMKHLIVSENCKLIFLELPGDVCVRWNLYLQGEDMYENQLIEELKFVQRFAKFY